MTPSKELCYFIDTIAVSGAERYLVDMIQGMRRRGYSVTVVCHHFPDLINAIQRETQGSCRVLSCRLPSITRNKAIQAGLTLNRSARGLLNILKVPGLLLYYWNTLVCFLKLWPVLKELHPDILHVSAGGYPAGESHRAAILVGYLQKISRRVLTIHSHVLPPPIRYPERRIDRFIEASLQLGVTAYDEST